MTEYAGKKPDQQKAEVVGERAGADAGPESSEKTLDVRFTALERPGGETPENCFLVQAAVAALEAEGVEPVFDVKSTDANMPMSLGIPAITVASGGKAGNAHALDEWHDITGRTKELAALARMVFAVAG